MSTPPARARRSGPVISHLTYPAVALGALTVLVAGRPAGSPAAPAPGFAVRYRNVVSPDRVRALTVLPNETVTLEVVARAPGSAYVARPAARAGRPPAAGHGGRAVGVDRAARARALSHPGDCSRRERLGHPAGVRRRPVRPAPGRIPEWLSHRALSRETNPRARRLRAAGRVRRGHSGERRRPGLPPLPTQAVSVQAAGRRPEVRRAQRAAPARPR